MIMNEYERRYWRMMVDFALTRAPSKIVPTIWKYTKKVMLYMCDESLFGEKQAPFACYREDSFNAGVAIKGIQFYTTYPEFPYVEAVMSHLAEYQEELLKCNDFKKYVKYMQKYEATPKYKLSKKKKNHENLIVYQIEALKPFTFYYDDMFRIIRKGEKGGWIESEHNLSQEGSCWIDNSVIVENARIEDDALVIDSIVCGNATVKDSAVVKNSSYLTENVLIEKQAIIDRSDVFNNALISDKSCVYFCQIYDYVEIYGNSHLFDCNISQNVWIDSAEVLHKRIEGYKKIKGKL